MIIDTIFGMVLGMLLAVIGYPFYTWQFWAVMLLVIIWNVVTHVRAAFQD